jgi:hypothetical protein
MRYPGLEKYATGSGPGTGGAKPPKKSKLGPIAAGLGTIAAGASVSQNPSEDKNKKPSGKVSNIEKPKKTVTGEDVRKSFDTAFATERKLKGSKGTFRWTDPSSGKSGTYTTKLRGESVDNFDLILDALLIEGYSNSEALKIMSNLDESAIARLASGAIKNVIKSGGSKLSKTKLPPKVDKAFQLVKQALLKQHGQGALMGTPTQKYDAAKKAAELRKNPPVKPQKTDRYPGDVYSKDGLGGIRGYRSGD